MRLDPQLRARALLVLGLLGILIWPAPHIDALRSPNELTRVYLVRAIVDDGSVSLDGPVARYGRLTDRAQRDGRAYSDKAPGLSLLSVPIYAAARLFASADALENAFVLRTARTMTIVLPTALWLLILSLWLEGLGVGRAIADCAVIGLALGSPAFAYTLRFEGHQAAAWMLGIGLAAAWWGRTGSMRWRLLAGLCGGLAAITEYPTAPMLFALALLAVWGAPRPWRGLLTVAAGATIPLGLAAWYHTAAFGNPWTTGYSYIAHPTFRSVHATGLLGVGLPSLDAIIGVSVSAQRGLFIIAPWLLSSVLGMLVGLAATRGAHRLLIVVLSLNLAVLGFVATGFGYWVGGWSVGPRHLVSALPAATILGALGAHALATAARERSAWLRHLLAVLARAAVTAGILCCSAAALTFPGFPEDLTSPLTELSFPLLSRGQFSYSLGTSFGLRSDLAMLPAVVGVVAYVLRVTWGSWRRPSTTSLWEGGAAGWIAIAFVVLLFASAPPARPEAVFRVAWLTQTMWQPKDVERRPDTRLARWEHAHRRRDRPTPEQFTALGAVEAYRGNMEEALKHYARAAWGSPGSVEAP